MERVVKRRRMMENSGALVLILVPLVVLHQRKKGLL